MVKIEAYMICACHQTLLGCSNQGGWDGWGMWQRWGGEKWIVKK